MFPFGVQNPHKEGLVLKEVINGTACTTLPLYLTIYVVHSKPLLILIKDKIR